MSQLVFQTFVSVHHEPSRRAPTDAGLRGPARPASRLAVTIGPRRLPAPRLAVAVYLRCQPAARLAVAVGVWRWTLRAASSRPPLAGRRPLSLRGLELSGTAPLPDRKPPRALPLEQHVESALHDLSEARVGKRVADKGAGSLSLARSNVTGPHSQPPSDEVQRHRAALATTKRRGGGSWRSEPNHSLPRHDVTARCFGPLVAKVRRHGLVLRATRRQGATSPPAASNHSSPRCYVTTAASNH